MSFSKIKNFEYLDDVTSQLSDQFVIQLHEFIDKNLSDFITNSFIIVFQNI